MQQLEGVDVASGGCSSSQKGCGFRGFLFIIIVFKLRLAQSII